MVVSQTTEYALRAGTALARANGLWLTNQQIASTCRVPAGYLAKILQALTRAQLVASQRGMGGGFTLARHPADITILDIVNAVDPVTRIRRCPLNLPEHGQALCPLHQALDDAIAVVKTAFADKTLEDLVSAAGGRATCAQDGAEAWPGACPAAASRLTQGTIALDGNGHPGGAVGTSAEAPVGHGG